MSTILTAERLEEIRARCRKSEKEPNFDHLYCLPLVDVWALFGHIDALAALTPPAEGEVGEIIERLGHLAELDLPDTAMPRVAADLLSRLSAEVARVTDERNDYSRELSRTTVKLQAAERARDEAVAALSEARANGLLEAADMCSRFEDCGPSFIAQRLRDSAAALTALRAASQPTGEA